MSRQDEITEAKVIEMRTNIENAIKLHRNDIVVTLINEWNKMVTAASTQSDGNNNNNNNNSDSFRYFFNEPYCDGQTKTPLHLAYELNDFDILRSLLNFGADPSVCDRVNKKTIYDLAFGNNQTPIKQILVDAFLQAIIQDNLKQIGNFLNCGLNVNSTECLLESNTFLHWACLYSNESTIRFLCDSGANINAQNQQGITPMFDFVVKRKSETRIFSYLLSLKPNMTTLKVTDGPYRDKCVLDMCDDTLVNLINESLNESTNSESLNGSGDPVPSTPDVPKTPPSTPRKLTIATDSEDYSFEPLTNWCLNSDLVDKNTANDEELLKLLWPRPQSIVLNTLTTKRFQLNEPFYIYVRTNVSAYIEFLTHLSSVFTDINFVFVHKEPQNQPHICVTIDENLFHIESSYIINVKENKIDIYVADRTGLQYAFCTFLQLCNLFSAKHIPSLKINDYPSTKYRGVLIDFSQGFYFKSNYLLSLLQMLAYFKINQIHFYAKFSSKLQNKRQWYHCLENWFEIIRFCDQFNLTIVPTIDIYNDVVDLYDVLPAIKEYLDLFRCCRFINVGPRLSTLLTCIENKNPFLLDSTQYLMLCSYLYQNNDQDVVDEIEKFDKIIFMEYGLKVGHNFNQKCQKLHESGKPFYLCIGSSNWNSLFGCPDGCVLNLFDALNNIESNKPTGLLLCEFVGALTKTPFAFNLNSILMFAGPSWNHNIDQAEFRKYLPSVINAHGLITDRDGPFGIIMLELGHVETYLTRRGIHLKNFEGLPLDTGSIFSRLILHPDEIELDFLDLANLRKTFGQLRTLQIKLRTIVNDSCHQQFKEVLITIEIATHLLKLLINLYNAGTKQQVNTVGLSVINVGINNISKTFKTDLANRIIGLSEELHDTLIQYYYEECLNEKSRLFESFVEKLLNYHHKDFSLSNHLSATVSRGKGQSMYFNND